MNEPWTKLVGDFFYRTEIAGLLGALVSLRWTPYGTGFFEKAGNLFASWVAASYLTEPAAMWGDVNVTAHLPD